MLTQNLLIWQKNTSKNDVYAWLNIPGLSFSQIRELAFECCFMKRRAKKIDAPNLLALMCIESQKGSPSYNDLVARLETVCDISASKQAMWTRVKKDSCVMFFKAVLAKLIKHRVNQQGKGASMLSGKYQRVIVQDSTIIKLPQRLFNMFSGVSNSHKAVCNARIQAVYDLISGQFAQFSIDSYSKNDIVAASELNTKSGDLVLRDRGYYTNDEAQRHISTGADFIYRYKHKTTFLDPHTKKPLNLLALLKTKSVLDMQVCLNNEKQTKVRIVAMPVSEQTANTRKRKAKKESKRKNPSEEVLELMGWTIFITNINPDKATFFDLLNIYRLRWRIEIIYKTLKSHMAFATLHQVSFNQLQVILTARLIMIVISAHELFQKYDALIFRQFNINLSMMKFMSYMIKNPEKFFVLILALRNNTQYNIAEICHTLKRYCTYDKRKRLNHFQLMNNALLS